MSRALWPALLPPARQGDDRLCAVSARGVRVRFADGRELLCGTSGLWNANLGYGNSVISAAASQALRDASYLSVFRAENSYARAAAAALIASCGARHFGRVIFSTSGGAANDLAMKLVRQYHQLRGQDQRKLIVGLRGSFHGLTFGAFSLTGEQLGQHTYGVDQRLIRHVMANDPDELAVLLERQGPRIAAVVVEPVLGSGTIPLREDYVRALLAARDTVGFLVVADEVATGFGRTGPLFATDLWPDRPDLLIASKGLTNGVSAAAAVIVSQQVSAEFDADHAILTHAETQAGTPVTCAAILATLGEFERLAALESGRRVAAQLDEHLAELAASHPFVSTTTGVGCFRSIQVRARDGAPLSQVDVPTLVAKVRELGALVYPGPNGIQLVPALVYTDAEVDELMHCVRAGLDCVGTGL